MLFLDDPNKEEVGQIMEENENIKEAVDELTGMSEDEELRRVAFLVEKGRRDEEAALEYATDKGIEEGLKQGLKQKEEEMVINMLKKGLSLSMIAEMTGLEEKELEENENIKKALDELTGMSEDEELRRVADLVEKGRQDKEATLEYATDEGRKQGEKSEKLRIAKNMLNKGMSVKEIEEITELSKETIEKLKK